MTTHSARTITRRAAIAAAAVAAVLGAAPAASAYITVGSGRFASPGLTVDAAGTAYIAWNGPENGDGPLYFCRLARGAPACDAGVGGTITSPGTSLSRPFITVSGDRVVIVQFRYGTGVPGFSALLAYTSTNRGASFGAPLVVGKIPFTEAVAGPGDTMSGVTSACGACGGLAFQNVPTDGSAPVNLDGTSTTPSTLLSEDHLYTGAIGLADAATPVAVFANNGGASTHVRRYSGSGSINDAANWTAPVEIGRADYPTLAGGPRGLVMLAGDGNGNVFAKKDDGSTFGAPVTIGAGSAVGSHVFQDAAGRLHAVYGSGDANGRYLIHAVSDDGGATWRKGVRETETDPARTFADMRVATAADHIGVASWVGGAYEVRVTGMGPDAPAPPAVTPRLTFKAGNSVTRVGTRFRIRIRAELVAPAGVADAAACKGQAKVTLKRGKVLVIARTLRIARNCDFGFTAFVSKSKVKRARKLTLRIAFLGNAALARATRTRSVSVK